MEDIKEEFNNLYDYIKKEGLHKIISSNEKLQEIKSKFQILNEEDICVCLYLVAIDIKDSKSINDLNNIYLNKNVENNEEKKDIYNIIYNRKLFDQKRLKIIYSMNLMNEIQFKITPALFMSIIENKDMKFLNIILENIYYGNEFIITLISSSKYNNIKSNVQLENSIDNEIKRTGFLLGINQLNKEQKNIALSFAFENKYEDLIKILLINDITRKDGKNHYPLHWVFNQNNTLTILLLLEYANNNNIVLELNEKNIDDQYPLLLACYQNNIEMIHILMEYADKNKVILELNGKDKDGKYPLLMAIQSRNIEITQLLIEYCEKNNIILNDLYFLIYYCNKEYLYEEEELLIDYANKCNVDLKLNENITNESNLLVRICSFSKIGVLKKLLENANKHNTLLKLNEKDNDGKYPLLVACANSFEKVKLLMEYANENNIILNVNEKDNSGKYPLLLADSVEKVKLLEEYADKNNITLKVNEKDDKGNYPLLYACTSYKVEIIKSLMEYASNHNIILELNEKDYNGRYPVLCLSYKCVNENQKVEKAFKLLEEYANNNNIILKVNEKDNGTRYPLLNACMYNNIRLIRLLMEYANKHDIILELNEKSEREQNPFECACEHNNFLIVKLLADYAKKNNITLDMNTTPNHSSTLNKIIKLFF